MYHDHTSQLIRQGTPTSEFGHRKDIIHGMENTRLYNPCENHPENMTMNPIPTISPERSSRNNDPI